MHPSSTQANSISKGPSNQEVERQPQATPTKIRQKYHVRDDSHFSNLPLRILLLERTRILLMPSTNVQFAQMRSPEIPKFGRVKLVGQCSILVVSRDGLLMKDLRRLSSEVRMGSCLHHGSGDVRDAIYRRMFYHQTIHVGVRRRQTRDLYPAFHLILVGRHVANIECCPRRVLTLANFYVTLVRVLHVPMWVLFKAAFVARNPHPGDVSIPITTLGGAVARSVEI